MESLMREAFGSCIVRNKEIKFIKNYSGEELDKIYKQFTKDLLDANIPNYRVIGFWHDWDTVHQHSVFRTNDIFGMSLIELAKRMQYVIPEKIGGNDPKVGCFFGVDEDASENLKDMNIAYGYPLSVQVGNRKTNILKLPKSEIGALCCNANKPPEAEVNEEINTNSIWYCQFGVTGNAKWPNMLIKDKHISKITKPTRGEADIIMFIKKGTGFMNFDETQDLFVSDYEKIMPCNTSYDLSRFFTVKNVQEGDTTLKLVYHEPNLNEDVLNTILREYGKEWVQK